MLKRIKRRYDAAVSAIPLKPPKLATALRGVLREGYDLDKAKRDVLAGLVVGIVALPLSMALAIATGGDKRLIPPQHGLYTAIVAGFLAALFSGSRTQVTGPTAAFVVVLVPIVQDFGLGGLLIATVLAGLILLALGLMRLGRLIQYIPYPVTTGFTAGIAVTIAILQVPDFLGLTIPAMPKHTLEKVGAIVEAIPSANPGDVAIGVGTLACLLLWPRLTKRLPAPLVALTFAAIAVAILTKLVPGFHAVTIGSRFSYLHDGITSPGIPRLPPLPVAPWDVPNATGGKLELSLGVLRQLMGPAFAIAMLGAIESLLSAVVADGMAGTKHDPDTELVAQGIANIAAPFFGGFAATGAIARTATNIRSGGRSPIAAMVHALFVLAAVLVLAPLLAYLPMASLAALLLIVAYNMSEVKHFVHVVRVAPKSDVAVQLTCFSLTVVFDMVVSVTAGVMLAALLFMRRMAEISGARLADSKHPALREPLPKGIVLYEIAGPLFFGAAQAAMSSLDAIAGQARTVILDLASVPAMDATGLVNLESSLERLHRDKSFVILSGVQTQPRKVLQRAGIREEADHLAFADDVGTAIALAKSRLPPEGHAASQRTPIPPSSRKLPASAR